MKKVLRPVGGHILDIEPIELSDQVLSLARNVNMRRGFPSRIRGRAGIYSNLPSINPLHTLNFDLNGFNWWLVFGADEIWALESSNYHDVSIPSQIAVSNPYEWSSTLLNGIPVFTNGRNAPQYWTGDSSDNAIALPGFPATTLCKFIVAFRFHLFALDIDSPSGVFNNLILWSDATEPGAIPSTWTAAAGNEAGSAFLADSPGRCVAGVPLGTQLMIYKPTSFHAVEYAGQPPDNIFTVRPVVRSTGLISPHALKTIGTSQAVVGNEDVVLTDGINIRSIADNRIKQALKNGIDETNSQNVFSIYDDHARELWVCAPEPGSQFATVAHIWDERRDNWVTRDLNAVRYGTIGFVTDTAASQVWNDDGATWDSDLSIWNEAQQGGAQKVVLVQDVAANPIDGFFVTGGAAINGSTWSKVSGGAAFDSTIYAPAAQSNISIEVRPGSSTLNQIVFGFHTTNAFPSTIHRGFIFKSDNKVYIRETAEVDLDFGTYLPTDVFKVTFNTTTVTYHKNGSLLQTTGTVAAALFAGANFFTVGDSLTNVVVAATNGLFVEDVPALNLVDAVIQRADLTFDDPEQRKVTNRVMIEGKGAGLSQLFVRLGARNSTDDGAGIQWGPYVQRKAEGNEYEVTGRFISVEVSNNTSAAPWTVTRITIEAEYDGPF